MTEADIENLIGTFEDDKTYVLTGKELNAIKSAIKRTNPIGAATRETTSGTEILGGSKTLTLQVDINGTIYDVKFPIITIAESADQ